MPLQILGSTANDAVDVKDYHKSKLPLTRYNVNQFSTQLGNLPTDNSFLSSKDVERLEIKSELLVVLALCG